MKTYPLFVNMDGWRIPVLGGGDEALRKARLLLAAGAEPVLIWPSIDEGIVRELGTRAVYVRRSPAHPDYAQARIAFVATGDTALSGYWAEKLRAAGVLVNAVDLPALCDFVTPSIINRGHLTVAISTGGTSPVFGRSVRTRIEAMLPRRTGELLDMVAACRKAVNRKFAGGTRRFWERFFKGPVAAAMLSGDAAGARKSMQTLLDSPPDCQDSGVVHIVGAGPGDPDLLTLKALRLIQEADVIIHDRLVGDGILDLARRDADRIYAGKARADHSLPQDRIEKTMIELARRGKTVVRLKGGDPFVFGRGGEELEAMHAAGIPVFVTPGITAATGCAAAAGLPLTHRDHSGSVTFITGHARDMKDPDIDWSALAALKGTLVVYMGIARAGSIAQMLMKHGCAAEMPAAIIENGTCAGQFILKTTLDEMPAAVEKTGITGPALLVIGAVAAFADGRTFYEWLAEKRLVA